MNFLARVIPCGANWRYSRFAVVRRIGDWWLPKWGSLAFRELHANPRPGNLGFFRPSRWDGKGFPPYVLHALLAGAVIAAVVLYGLA